MATELLPIQCLGKGYIFEYKGKRLQLSGIEKEGERFVCVDPDTEPRDRSKVEMQTWLKRDTKVKVIQGYWNPQEAFPANTTSSIF